MITYRNQIEPNYITQFSINTMSKEKMKKKY